jgi:hypothetical protein
MKDTLTSAERVVEWRRRTKIRAVVYRGGRCVVCGYSRYFGGLAFHHLDDEKKEATVSQMMANPKAWSTIMKELDKCALLCHNCHSEVHGGVLDLRMHLFRSPSPAEGVRLLKRWWETLPDNERKHLRPPHPSLSQQVCPLCGGTKDRKAKTCAVCRDRRSKINWPDSARLLQMVQETSYLAVGRELGVSDNAVRKRLKRHPPE